MGERLKVINIVGARPNFMKIAPIMEEMKRRSKEIEPLLVHTGQHYDEAMSKVFFKDLGIPRPDIDLGVGSGTHAVQTASVMLGFEKVLIDEKPDMVLVVGDVNSTLACALTAVKLNVAVAHVEAGLRSFDRAMPEEINRIVTDAVSDYLFTTSAGAGETLMREGVPEDKIFFVGNVMIDTLLKHIEKARLSKVKERLGLNDRPYILTTLHRPSNVDSKENFKKIATALEELGKKVPVIFPVHPRTRRSIEDFGLGAIFRPLTEGVVPEEGLWFTEPFGYLDFLCLMDGAKVVLTDSGGIQEETTILRVPCVTIRENTERPVTITEGTNVLVGTETEKIIAESVKALEGSRGIKKTPKLWDGSAATRIVDVILNKAKNTARVL